MREQDHHVGNELRIIGIQEPLLLLFCRPPPGLPPYPVYKITPARGADLRPVFPLLRSRSEKSALRGQTELRKVSAISGQEKHSDHLSGDWGLFRFRPGLDLFGVDF